MSHTVSNADSLESVTRRARFSHLEPLPEGWHIVSDDVLEPYVEWLRKGNAGWVERETINRVLGLAHNPNFRFEEYLEVESVNVPGTSFPTLYRPITFDEAAAMEGFARLLKRIFCENNALLVRCMLSAPARAAALAAEIGK